MPTSLSLSEQTRWQLLDQAQALMDGARRIILRRLAGGFRTDLKSDGSPVTQADLETEQYLRDAIATRFPGHGVVGEEFEATNPGAEFQWIIDPIDGTISFSRGIPLYGSILALRYGGQPLLGLIDHPSLDTRYSAAMGLGTWCNGERVQLADQGQALDQELLATGTRSHFVKIGRGEAFDRLLTSHPQVRTYSDCFGHTLAIAGKVGAMVDFGVRLWDLAASQVLVAEAGGRFEIPVQTDQGQFGVIFGKPRVVEALLPLFE